MYLSQLQYWSDKQWANKLAPFSLTKEQKYEVRQVLTMPNKESLLANRSTLLRHGIVNGLGPYYFPKIFRDILTYLFPYIDWFFHDIGVFLAETREELLEADRGIKKYGFVSINKKTEEREDTGLILLISYDFFIATPVKSLVVYIFYGLLRLFSRFSAKDIIN